MMMMMVHDVVSGSGDRVQKQEQYLAGHPPVALKRQWRRLFKTFAVHPFELNDLEHFLTWAWEKGMSLRLTNTNSDTPVTRTPTERSGLECTL